jgi:dolichol-phosphate mannosyltransferase
MTAGLAVIVPLYNDVGNVEAFYTRARAVLEAIPIVDWRMVFVNDASTDGGYEKVCELNAADPRVGVICLSRNFGYHAALLAGLTLVAADRYTMIDIDGEDPPELLSAFHSAIEEGADIAYGIRSQRIEPAPLTFFRRVFYYLNRGIADSDIVVWMSEFAMITRQVRDTIIAPHTTYVFLRAEMGYAGFLRVGIPYTRGRRMSGESHYNFLGLAKFAVAAFLASSTFPLRFILYLAIAVGLLFPVVALLGGLGAAAIGAFAAVTTLYFALIALSTIGLYLARTYKNGVARPVFIVNKDKTRL